MATVLNLFLASLVSGIPIRQWNVEFDSPSAVRRILDPDVGAHLARRADTSHDMKYYGGPILQNIEVTTIFYGSGVLYQNETNAFYEFLVKSPYMAMLFEYNAGYGRFIGSYLETNNIKTVVDDKLDIIPYLKGLVQAGILKPNANSYYPIHFAPGTNITQGNSKSCINFCGYHGTIDISTIYNGTKYLSYGVLPSHTGQCYGGCGRSVDPFRNLCSISSHELAEAVTNPAIGVVTRL
ncbi:hypothetical protein BDR26DRAFT_157322 [Obelidium mucronatum]|nr:hypothetical protein BDR26DRAFT_157322 [Obelidium mucronatum]